MNALVTATPPSAPLAPTQPQQPQQQQNGVVTSPSDVAKVGSGILIAVGVLALTFGVAIVVFTIMGIRFVNYHVRTKGEPQPAGAKSAPPEWPFWIAAIAGIVGISIVPIVTLVTGILALVFLDDLKKKGEKSAAAQITMWLTLFGAIAASIVGVALLGGGIAAAVAANKSKATALN